MMMLASREPCDLALVRCERSLVERGVVEVEADLVGSGPDMKSSFGAMKEFSNEFSNAPGHPSGDGSTWQHMAARAGTLLGRYIAEFGAACCMCSRTRSV